MLEAIPADRLQGWQQQMLTATSSGMHHLAPNAVWNSDMNGQIQALSQASTSESYPQLGGIINPVGPHTGTAPDPSLYLTDLPKVSGGHITHTVTREEIEAMLSRTARVISPDSLGKPSLQNGDTENNNNSHLDAGAALLDPVWNEDTNEITYTMAPSSGMPDPLRVAGMSVSIPQHVDVENLQFGFGGQPVICGQNLAPLPIIGVSVPGGPSVSVIDGLRDVQELLATGKLPPVQTKHHGGSRDKNKSHNKNSYRDKSHSPARGNSAVRSKSATYGLGTSGSGRKKMGAFACTPGTEATFGTWFRNVIGWEEPKPKVIECIGTVNKPHSKRDGRHSDKDFRDKETSIVIKRGGNNNKPPPINRRPDNYHQSSTNAAGKTERVGSHQYAHRQQEGETWDASNGASHRAKVGRDVRIEHSTALAKNDHKDKKDDKENQISINENSEQQQQSREAALHLLKCMAKLMEEQNLVLNPSAGQMDPRQRSPMATNSKDSCVRDNDIKNQEPQMSQSSNIPRMGSTPKLTPEKDWPSGLRDYNDEEPLSSYQRGMVAVTDRQSHTSPREIQRARSPPTRPPSMTSLHTPSHLRSSSPQVGRGGNMSTRGGPSLVSNMIASQPPGRQLSKTEEIGRSPSGMLLSRRDSRKLNLTNNNNNININNVNNRNNICNQKCELESVLQLQSPNGMRDVQIYSIFKTPTIKWYQDFLSLNEVADIRTLSEPYYKKVPGDFELSLLRHVHTHPLVVRLRQRAAHFLGVTLERIENPICAVYPSTCSVGKHDAAPHQTHSLVIFLTDGSQGVRTTFPELEFSVPAKAGSCVCIHHRDTKGMPHGKGGWVETLDPKNDKAVLVISVDEPGYVPTGAKRN